MVETFEVKQVDDCSEDSIECTVKPANVPQQVKDRIRVAHIRVQVFVEVIPDLADFAACCCLEFLLKRSKAKFNLPFIDTYLAQVFLYVSLIAVSW